MDREQIARAGLAAQLPEGYQWGPDALEHFEIGKRRAVEAILALLSPAIEGRRTGEGFVHWQNRALQAEELLTTVGRRARSDGDRTFDDCIRDLGLIDDLCRSLPAAPDQPSVRGEGHGSAPADSARPGPAARPETNSLPVGKGED